MSQKKEKYARSIEARVSEVEHRMDDVCRRQIISDHYTAALKQVHDWSEETLLEERKKRRREVREAQREANRWKANAVLALVLLGLVSACCIVYVYAGEPETPQDGTAAQYLPDDGRVPGDDIPATERCYMEPEEVEAAENEMIEAALLERATRLDDVTVTHYDCCLECCGKTQEDPAYGITASGLRATPGVSVGVDPDVIPLGADVLVDYGDGELHYPETGCPTRVRKNYLWRRSAGEQPESRRTCRRRTCRRRTCRRETMAAVRAGAQNGGGYERGRLTTCQR